MEQLDVVFEHLEAAVGHREFHPLDGAEGALLLHRVEGACLQPLLGAFGIALVLGHLNADVLQQVLCHF